MASSSYVLASSTRIGMRSENLQYLSVGSHLMVDLVNQLKKHKILLFSFPLPSSAVYHFILYVLLVFVSVNSFSARIFDSPLHHHRSAQTSFMHTSNCALLHQFQLPTSKPWLFIHPIYYRLPSLYILLRIGLDSTNHFRIFPENPNQRTPKLRRIQSFINSQREAYFLKITQELKWFIVLFIFSKLSTEIIIIFAGLSIYNLRI